MIAVLRLDSRGTITAASPDATEILGPCVGRRCCDVVLARASDRTLLCTPDCAAAVAQARSALEHRGACVAGRLSQVICGAADGSPVVIVRTDSSGEVHQASLSPREEAALERVAAGLSDKEIAAELGVEPSTVKTLLTRARDKLGARNRAQAVAIALRANLIS